MAVLVRPYGNPITTTDVGGSSPTEPLRFAGQYLGSELGQYDMRAREYDPASMRFDSQDPVAAPLTQPYTGAYVYADADPASETDPTGRAGGGLGGCAVGGASSCPAVGGTDPVTRYVGGVVAGAEQTVVDTLSALFHEAEFQATSGCFVPEVALVRSTGAEHDLNTLKTTVTGTITTLGDCFTGTGDANAQACGHIAVAVAGTAAGGEGACTLADTLAGEEVGESGLIFRGGSQTDNALTDRGSGLSFRDSLSNPIGGRPVLRPGEKYFRSTPPICRPARFCATTCPLGM